MTLVYFDRNATMRAAKRPVSGGMHRPSNAAWVSPQAVRRGGLRFRRDRPGWAGLRRCRLPPVRRAGAAHREKPHDRDLLTPPVAHEPDSPSGGRTVQRTAFCSGRRRPDAWNCAPAGGSRPSPRCFPPLHPGHADPADRFIVGAAKVFGLRLVTADPRLLRCPGVETVWGDSPTFPTESRQAPSGQAVRPGRSP